MFTEYLENLKIQFPNYMIDFNTEVVYDEGCNLQYYSEGIARASCVQEIYGEVKVYE